MKQTDAIVVSLAGKVQSDLAVMAPHGRKSLIELNGRTAISYLVENLKLCSGISQVIVVSDQPGFDAAPGADVFIEAGGDMSDCVMQGIGAVNSERCLIMAGDMPLASSESITDLLKCSPESDVVYPIVGKADVVDVFPGRSAFYVETKEGHFTGSSCLLFDPKVAMSRQEMLTRLLGAKNSPKEMLGLLGPALAMRLMLSKLALREFEEHLSRVLDMSCRVFITHFPEMLVSIDTAGDVGLMERELLG